MTICLHPDMISPTGVGPYLTWLTARRCSPTTIYSRRRALTRLAVHLAADPLTATHDQLYAWQQHLATRMVPASQRAEMSAVRQFFRWAVAEGLVTVDPTARLILPRAPRGVPRPASDEIIALALATADTGDLAAIIALAALAGLRAVEIARLDRTELGERVQVTGKGGHLRVVPVSTELRGFLDRLPGRHGPVIPRLDGDPGYNEAHRISQRANAHLAAWGITLHQLRHRYITVAYQAGGDLRAAQILAGHASPTTTSGYAEASSEAVTRAAAAAGRLAARAS